MSLSRSRRHAFSLVEVLVVLALLGIVLSSVVTTVYSLHRTDRTMQQHMVESAALSRLGHQLRRDAHQVQSAEVNDRRLRLTQDDRAIEYELAKQQLRRTEYQGGEAVRREAYPLTAAEVEWRIDTDNRLLTLVVRQHVGPTSGGAVHVSRIEAALNVYERRGQP